MIAKKSDVRPFAYRDHFASTNLEHTRRTAVTKQDQRLAEQGLAECQRDLAIALLNLDCYLLMGPLRGG
jgi:hypothetical protein